MTTANVLDNKKEASSSSLALLPDRIISTDIATPTADQDFVLGERVEVRTRNGNATWDGLRGRVKRMEQYEITVQLDEDKWKYLRFYRDERLLVPALNEELNRMIESASRAVSDSDSLKSEFKSFYKCGDLVLIDCPTSAEKEYRQWNGSWGLVKSVGRSSIKGEATSAPLLPKGGKGGWR